LLQNNFGNFVLQKALKLSKNENHKKLIDSINKNLEKINDKKLFDKWIPILSQINSRSFSDSPTQNPNQAYYSNRNNFPDNHNDLNKAFNKLNLDQKIPKQYQKSSPIGIPSVNYMFSEPLINLQNPNQPNYSQHHQSNQDFYSSPFKNKVNTTKYKVQNTKYNNNHTHQDFIFNSCPMPLQGHKYNSPISNIEEGKAFYLNILDDVNENEVDEHIRSDVCYYDADN